ncbi:MAG: anti-sigma factor family protein [Planctomycetota bacterium]|jgi:hypothetical protein
MNCESAKQLIDDLVYGLLDGTGEAEARAHIESCAACAAEFEKAEKRKGAFLLWKVTAPARDLTRAVMERVRNIPPPMRRKIVRWTFRLTAAAAVLLIAIFSIYVMSSFGGTPTPENLAIVSPSYWAPTAYVGLAFRFVDAETGKPIPDATLSADLVSQDGERASLIRSQTDAGGRAAGTCRIPDWSTGRYSLIVEATKKNGEVERVIRPVILKRSYHVYVRADRPLYRPENPVRARAIILDRSSGKPVAGSEVKFLLTTKAPRSGAAHEPLAKPLISKTSRFGVASAEFPAEAVSAFSQPRLHLTAVVEGEPTAISIPFSTKPLPRFRVTCKTDKPYYIAGETVSASIRVKSLEGKPVGGLPIKIEFSGTDAPAIDAQLPADGVFQVPPFKAPPNLALLLVRTGGDKNEPAARFRVISAQSPVTFRPLPGSGLLKNTAGKMYVIGRRPDGTPAANLRFIVAETGEALLTDKTGLAYIKIPAGETALTLEGDMDARPFSVSMNLSKIRRDAVIITDNSRYRGGDMARIDVLSSGGSGDYYACLVRGGQVIAATTTARGEGSKTSSGEISIPPSIQGLVKVHAFNMDASGLEPVATAAVFVEPPEGLVLSAEVERDAYAAGSDEKVRITVNARDDKGNPQVVALPAEVTDAALFEYVSRQSASGRALFGEELLVADIARRLAPEGTVFPKEETPAAALLSQRTSVREKVFERTSSLSEKKQQQRRGVIAFTNRLISFRFILIGCVLFALGALLLLRNFIQLATGEERKSITLTKKLGIAFSVFLPCALAWHLGWGYWAGAGDPIVQALAHVLVPAGVILAAAVVLGILRRGADGEGTYNPVIFEAGALIGVYQLVAIFVPWSDAFAFRPEYLPFVAASLVFFAGSLLAVIRIRRAGTAGRSIALRASGVLGPAVVTAVILALALAPIGTLPPGSISDTVKDAQLLGGESLYWNPMLVTDDTGRAEIELSTPDRAGTWIFHTDGIGADGKLGAVSIEIQVTDE